MNQEKGPESLRGHFLPKSICEEERTIDVIWATGTRVRRSHPQIGRFWEEISLDPQHLRMERLENGAPVLNNHQEGTLSDQIGVVTRAWVEDGKGMATLKFSKRPEVEIIWEDVKAGIYRNVSVGYRVYRSEEVGEADGLPVIRAMDTEFFEISMVTLPADPGARVRSEEDFTKGETVEKEKKEEKTASQEGKTAPPEAENQEMRKRSLTEEISGEILLKERDRVRTIMERCRSHDMPEDFTRKLLDDGCSGAEASQRILDALCERSQSGHIPHHSPGTRVTAGDLDEISTRRESMKQALLLSADPSLVRKEDLHDGVMQYAGRSIPGMIATELERRGEKVGSYSKSELVTRAFHSGSDFPLVMGMAGESAVKQSYLNLVKRQTFRPLVRYEVASDFLPMRKIQLGEMPGFERIPEGAEVSYGSLSEHGEQWAIGKYGEAFRATYELMVNDQKNLIFSAMSMYGAAAANLESNLVWNIFKMNPMVHKMGKDGINLPGGNRWFSKAHRNLPDAAPLCHDSLEEAEYLMSTQKGHDKRPGDELNLLPRFLIVPSRLKNTAKRLIYSQFSPTSMQDVNLYENQFDVISEARLNPEKPDKNTPYPWFLACDPSVLPVLWMAYLNGRQEPRTMYQTDFNTLSISIRADLDFGVSHGDWRAVLKNEGADTETQRKANQIRVPGEISA